MALRKSLAAFSPLLRPHVVQVRSFAATPNTIDLESSVSLQKARTWDEGAQGGFTVTSLSELFKGKKVAIFGLPGAYTGVCTNAHVPSYLRNADALKAKGVDTIVCVSVNDPYVMNAWGKSLHADDKIDFYGDFDGKFHKMLGLDLDLSGALLGHRSQRWSAIVDNGEIKTLNVEKSAGDFEVSSGDHLLKQI